MARRRHLIAYDICEPRRLRRVCKVMEAYGTRVQYSVFLCDMSAMEKAQWRSAIHEVMDYHEDSVIAIDLGALDSAAEVVRLGRAPALPESGATIV